MLPRCKLVPPPSHTASDVGNQKSKQYLRVLEDCLCFKI